MVEWKICPKFPKYAVRIGTNFGLKMHIIRTRLLDEHGLGSKKATRNFFKIEPCGIYNLKGLGLN